jgi:hypothetical protein
MDPSVIGLDKLANPLSIVIIVAIVVGVLWMQKGKHKSRRRR